MPSLDIAIVQPSLQTHLVVPGAQTLFHCKALSSTWKSSQLAKIVNISAGHPQIQRGKLFIATVATLESQCTVQKEDTQRDSQLSVDFNSCCWDDVHDRANEDSPNVDERERLRRSRISKANKGNTPWNKGRKHSAETLKRIRERTKLAMQSPKVRSKLVNLGHAQSEETKIKIAKGVRMGWERRREKLVVQETCHFEWQNLIADAARRGSVNEEELHWNSYKVLDQQLRKEWLESVEERKNMRRPQGSKRAPKSAEQKRKIAEAIAAKWADPEYRNRVYSGLARYHGTSAGAEKKKRRKPTDTGDSPSKKITRHVKSSPKSQNKIQRVRLRTNNKSVYKDPLANSKLEMIKNIRAQRAAAESKKVEAIQRARLLIAEAEKAAMALELAAMASPVAQASLTESRELIAEAIRSIEFIESGQITSDDDSLFSYAASTEQLDWLQKDTGLENGDATKGELGVLNGTHAFLTKSEDFNFAFNGESDILPASSGDCKLPTFSLDGEVSISSNQLGQMETDGNINCEKIPLANGTKVHHSGPNWNIKFENNIPNGAEVQGNAPLNKSSSSTKKWVCGKLVEITE